MKRLTLAAAAAAIAVGTPLRAEPIPTGSPSVSGYQPIGRDEQGLWGEAEEAERAFKTSKLVVRDPAINGYLRAVLCRTVGPEPCKAVRLYVVRTPLFNAFAMPNGAMVIFTGALLRIRDEAELSAILGHEFSHFEHRHSLLGLRSQRSAASWGAWLTVISMGAGQGINFIPTFAAAHPAYARDQERDADLTGIGMMRTAGFRLRSASEIWVQMREEEDHRAQALGVKSLKDAWRGPFATHPMDAERMTYLRTAADAFPDAPTYTGAEPYHAALATIWPTLIADQIKLNDFGGSEYLLAHLAEAGWTGPLLFARAELYRNRGAPADLLYAAGLYRQACATPDAPAESWRGLGLTLARQGDMAAAKAAITDYLTRHPDASDRAVLETLGEQ